MRFVRGVKALRLAPFALAALLVSPGALAAQDSSSGKIGDVQRSADNGKTKGGGPGDADRGGDERVTFLPNSVRAFFEGVAAAGNGVYLLFTYVPVMPGQGYARYPYAGGGPFVRQDAVAGRTFGAASASYFMDDQSRLRATDVSMQWAGGMLRREVELATYAEPTPTGTERLQMARLSFTAAPRLGDLGFATFGGGVQLVTLGSGDLASGPELEAGVQLFPLRPFGVEATVRVGPMTWSGGPEWGVSFADLSAASSVMVGRFELQAGYRWTRIGVGAPFRGPTLGLRVWL